MNLLIIADRPAYKPIPEILAENQIDIIVTLGDLDMAEIRALEGITTIPKIGVYGNHCSGQYMETLGIRNMHMTTWSFQGMTFGGFEGSVRYKPSPYAKMYTQEEAHELLKDFPHVDVMLSHCPPFGVNDDPSDIAHTGFHAMSDYLTRQKPRFWLHGHTDASTSKPEQVVGETKFIYTYGHQIIQIT